MNRHLQCQCGRVRGELKHAENATRLMCYCKDCRAFAHFLGKADAIIDPAGGVDVLVTHPQEIAFSSGADAIACMSLSSAGMLRWYARCCNTPIGNTSRNNKMAYVGLSAAFLADPATLERDIGPVRMRSFTEAARTAVPGSGIGTTLPLMMGFGLALLRARLDRSYRRTPFFKDGTNQPVAAPTVLADGAPVRRQLPR